MQGDPRRFTSLRDESRPFKYTLRRICLEPEASREEGRSRPFEMIEGPLRGLAATTGSFEETGLNQIGLMDIFEGAFVFRTAAARDSYPTGPPANLSMMVRRI